MRIIIDMQGAQGANRDKGIGRYSVALARGLVRQRGSHEIILVLNGMLADSIAPLRAIFNDILPPENIVVWGAAAPVSASNAENDLRREAAEVVRESFIASLRPDLVLLTSLFEGQADNGVTSIGACRNGLLTAVVLYDLDPLINPHLYYRSPLAERFYLSKIGHLRRADFVLSTSASTGVAKGTLHSSLAKVSAYSGATR